MAAVFNFDDILEMTIEGETFRVDVGETQGDKGKKLRELGKETMKIKEMVAEVGEEAATLKVMEMMKEGVDTLLGAGAFDRIFKDRTPTPLRCVNLITFITAEMEKYKLKQIIPAMNRAQRRKK